MLVHEYCYRSTGFVHEYFDRSTGFVHEYCDRSTGFEHEYCDSNWVNRVCPELVGRVLSQITETVAEELFRLMSCVTKFSVRGNQQARIDIQALQRFLKPFTLQRARGYFEEALEALPPLKPDELKLVDEVLSMSESKMRLQLYCFQSASISEAS
ncbi:exocyst complex component 2-like [Macrosteles quadrilineatus]|uniref:exocyst complex component 2-like n=1 Tax=Macrosteles quadrilineatus TaxID=74068 RepID=UPI0023E2CC0F|nr:exocyst complex component 2-like [Macrosteles quadrilineatus]